ncbi:hypothetical protein AAG906_041206 [Vitis piasezkii]
MAFFKTSQVMLMAIFVGIILLMSSEVATAATLLKLGRRVLGVPIGMDCGTDNYGVPRYCTGMGGFAEPPPP